MSKTDPYHQFPIGCLKVGKRLDDVTGAESIEILQKIFAASVIGLASHLSTVKDQTELRWMAEKWRDTSGINDADEWSRDEFAVCAALQTMRTNETHCRRYSTASELRRIGEATLSQAQQARRLVRIRANIFDDAQSGAIPWRKFAVLAAVLAGCNGNRQAERLTRAQLGAMAAGYSGARQLTAAGLTVNDVASEKQIRGTLNALTKRRFFSRCSVGRESWFSVSMTSSLLQKYVATVRQQRAERRAESGAGTRAETGAGTRAETGAATIEPRKPKITEENQKTHSMSVIATTHSAHEGGTMTTSLSQWDRELLLEAMSRSKSVEPDSARSLEFRRMQEPS
jgi:hypothetical protein